MSEQNTQGGFFCSKCGTLNPPGAVFCGNCGQPMRGAPNPQTAPVNQQAAPVNPQAAPVNPQGVPFQPAPAMGAAEPPNAYPSKYTNGAIMELLVGLGVAVGTICTLFIAFPFLYCAQQKWKLKNTYVNGRRLTFDGNGAQLIGKWILWILLSLITLGLYAIFAMPLNMQKWRTSHTHVEGYVTPDGKKGKSKFTGTIFGLFFTNLVCTIVKIFGVITFGYLTCWAKLHKIKWINEHRQIDGVKITNDAGTGAYFGHYIKWMLLSIVTLGIYFIFFKGNREDKFVAKHNHFVTPGVFPAPVNVK